MFSWPLLLSIILLSIAYGATMKIADLFDEHNVHWFKGDALLFGIVWGAFGAFLMHTNSTIATILLAQILAYLIRGSIDYLNHRIAAAIMILAFLFTSTFHATIFVIFFVTFIIFGGLRDYIGNKRKKKDWIYYINEPAWYYFLPPLIYSIITGNWLVFIAFSLYRLAYNTVKYIYHDF